jgi:prepilin-type N-terminal cleavage/methylation domain-containing protein/prepilin-type processing-associated H-X9-DG protein
VKNRIKKTQGFTLVELLVVVAIIAVLASLLLPVISRVKSEGRRAKCISNLRQISTGWLSYSLDWDAYVPFSDANAVITDHWALKLTPYVGARWSDRVYHCPDYRNTNNLIRPGFFLEQRGSYDINVVGTSANYETGRGVGGTIWIWGGPPTTTATQVADVRMPAELIAMGDVCVDSRFEREPFGYLNFYWYARDTYSGSFWMERALVEFNRRHKGMFNIQFADGHIESGKPNRFFKLEAAPMRRWNNDHEPRWPRDTYWPN